MGRILGGVVAALLSGALFAIAMPPADVQPLGWVCFVPLLVALRGMRFIGACLLPVGSLLFAAWLTTTGWLYSWPKGEGEDAWHYVGFLLFGVALLPAWVTASITKFETPWRRFALAALFVASESILLLYLPAHIALSQYRSPAMLTVASWFGIWGVSLLIWWVQLILADAIAKGKEGAVRAGAFGLAAVVLGLWEHAPPLGPNQGIELTDGEITVGVVQSLEPDLGTGLSDLGGRPVPQLVIWPELSGSGLAAGGNSEKLVELSNDSAPFVTSFTDGTQPMPYNAAALFAEGRESVRYYKRRPFGAEAGQHRAGEKAVAVPLGATKLGLNICFDSCFPNLIRDTARIEGVGLIALPCMGPESPYGVIQSIHGAFTPFRSAENGVAIARAETSAFAMVTDRYGRIVAEAPAGYQGVLLASVEPRARWTPARTIGDSVMYLCWAVVVFGAGVMWKNRGRKAPEPLVRGEWEQEERELVSLGVS